MNTKFKAALKMNALTPDGKVNKAQAVVASIQAATTYFPANGLPIPLASITASINNLHNAIYSASNGVAGGVSNMHDKEKILLSQCNLLRAYVEMVAHASLDPKTVIEAAGMQAVISAGYSAVTELTITALGNGAMQVSVPRNTGEAAFIYQYSTDGGTTWLELNYSKLATITLNNQTPATVLHFRYAPISKTKGAFSQIKSGIVL